MLTFQMASIGSPIGLIVSRSRFLGQAIAGNAQIYQRMLRDDLSGARVAE